LPESRGEIRHDSKAAARIPGLVALQGAFGVEQRIVRLAPTPEFAARGATSIQGAGSHPGGTCQKYKCRTTDSNHSLPVASNLLERRFTVNQPGAVWVSDITSIPTDEGWLYLAGVKDLFSKQIVEFSMAATMDKSLVLNALKRAVSVHRTPAGMLLHSDRGSQYCSHRYRRLASFYGFRLSMSNKGDCYDNAPMESFWGILKNELVHHKKYRTRVEAMADISEYIEIFYNRQRLQAGLDYLAPAEFGRLHHAKHCTNAA